MINSLSRILYMLRYGMRLPTFNLTLLVAASTTGIGILDLLHNGALAFSSAGLRHPLPNVRNLTSTLLTIGTAGGALLSPSLPLAASLVFDAAALFFAAGKEWISAFRTNLTCSGAIFAYRMFVFIRRNF